MAATEVPWAKKPPTDLDDFDIDELLGKLTAEDIEQLQTELIDPDDPHLPPSDRCRYHVDKKPTGPFDRKKLIEFLEKTAREEKDWDTKPFVKEIRGKVYKPKERPQPEKSNNGDEDIETEWDEVLAEATEEELVDLAAILGFHGMLNQVQYHQAFVEQKSGEEMSKGGFTGLAKSQALKLVPDEPPNDTDVDKSLDQFKDNDPKLKILNLNNIKNISIERLCEFGEGLQDNTYLEELHMANTRANDKVALAFAKGLKKNKTLKILNLESNFITGPSIVEILKGINCHDVMTEFRIANQRQSVLGNKIELQITNQLAENTSILKFGIFLQTSDARVRVSEYVKKNNDRLRKDRMGFKDDEPPKPKKEESPKPSEEDSESDEEEEEEEEEEE